MVFSIPVIDVFAGPGGLSEGFSAFSTASSNWPFRIRLSIEKDALAHRTLLLRAFFRQFQHSGRRVPAAYYDFLRDTRDTLEDKFVRLFNAHPAEAARAENEVRLAELGVADPELIRQWIDARLDGTENWVLLGGPPCQAYSLAGRSRNKGIEDYVPEDDQLQYLYVEYLKIIADHLPAVFIMENVKGLLSATLNDQRIFERICTALQNPVAALRREGRTMRRDAGRKRGLPHRYRLFSLVDYENAGRSYTLFPMAKAGASELKLHNFVVRMERHGIPQARHRVIILGVREDLSGVVPRALRLSDRVLTEAVLSGLPRLRSGLSREEDNWRAWASRLQEIAVNGLFAAACEKGGAETCMRLTASLRRIGKEKLGRGDEFISCAPVIAYRADWFLDQRLDGVCNHSARAHIVDDLYRYLYAACFASARGHSPHLRDFPERLLPAHANVNAALGGSNFSDRFRVHRVR